MKVGIRHGPLNTSDQGQTTHFDALVKKGVMRYEISRQNRQRNGQNPLRVLSSDPRPLLFRGVL